jgi:hypothetical protein
VKTEEKKKETAEEGDHVPRPTYTPLTQAAAAAPLFGQAPAQASTSAPPPAPAPAAPQTNTAKPTTTEPEKKSRTKFYADTNGAVCPQLGPHASAPALPSLNPFTALNTEQSATVPDSLYAGFGANVPNSEVPVGPTNPFASLGTTTPTSNARGSSATVPFGLPLGAFQKEVERKRRMSEQRKEQEMCEHKIVFGELCCDCGKHM